MEQITKNIYVEKAMGGCNIGLIVTDEGVIVIDTPMIPMEARKWMDEVSKYGPIRYVINTEPHMDQFAGNNYIEGPLIGHEGARKAILAASVKEIEGVLERFAPDSLPLEKGFKFRAPDITLSQRLNIHLGKHTFNLINMPGHSPFQVAVYIPEEKVLFATDNITSGMTFFYDALPYEWLDTLDRIEEMDIDILVPGHGEIGDKTYLSKMRGHVQAWIDAVEGAIDKGMSLEETKNTISLLDRYPEVAGNPRMKQIQMNNIDRIYKVLKNPKQ